MHYTALTYHMAITAPYGWVKLGGENIDIQDKYQTMVSDKDINKSGDSGDIKINCE